MKQEFDPRHLDIAAFANAQASLISEERLARFERLLELTHGLGAETPVCFQARGEMRPDAAGVNEAWLRLGASATLALTCQRCLGPVDIDVTISREFRFVATEELAKIEDEESEEDVLVLHRAFNLLELIEDELLMDLPTSPKHEACPKSVKLSVADADFVDDAAVKLHPFSVLSQLKKGDMG